MISPSKVPLGVDTVIISQVALRSNALGLGPRQSISLAFTFRLMDVLVIKRRQHPSHRFVLVTEDKGIKDHIDTGPQK